MLMVSLEATGRSLKQMITMLLKSGLATKIQRVQYVKSYTCTADKKLLSREQKILLISCEETKKEKLTAQILNLYPYATISLPVLLG